MKKFFDEYGKIIVTAVVAISLIAIAIALRVPIQSGLENIIDDFSGSFSNSFDISGVNVGDNNGGGSTQEPVIPSIPGATFKNADDTETTLTWEELKMTENGNLYGYTASKITDTNVNSHAFLRCTSLTEIIIPEGVTTINTSAFYNCTSLATVSLPSTLTNLEGSSFQNCDNLTTFNYNGTKEQWNAITKDSEWYDSAGNYEIHCTNACLNKIFETFNCPEHPNNEQQDDKVSVATFSDGKTLRWGDLKKYSNGVTYGFDAYKITAVSIDKAFYDCTSLTEIVIPEGITDIVSHAFLRCTSLTEIIIPEGVTTINTSAFYNCTSLATVSLPSTLTNLERSSFQNCDNLTTFNYNGTKEQWNAITKDSEWYDSAGNYTIHCTDGNIAKS